MQKKSYSAEEVFQSRICLVMLRPHQGGILKISPCCLSVYLSVYFMPAVELNIKSQKEDVRLLRDQSHEVIFLKAVRKCVNKYKLFSSAVFLILYPMISWNRVRDN